MKSTKPTEYMEKLQFIINRALAKSPDDRYTDAAAMINDIRALMSGQRIVPAPPPAMGVKAPAAASKTTLMLLSVGMLILASAVVISLGWQDKDNIRASSADPSTEIYIKALRLRKQNMWLDNQDPARDSKTYQRNYALLLAAALARSGQDHLLSDNQLRNLKVELCKSYLLLGNYASARDMAAKEIDTGLSLGWTWELKYYVQVYADSSIKLGRKMEAIERLQRVATYCRLHYRDYLAEVQMILDKCQAL